MERSKAERLSFVLKALWWPPPRRWAGRPQPPPQSGPPGHGLLPVLVLLNTDPRPCALDWPHHSQAAARGAWLRRASGVAPGPHWGGSQYPVQEKDPAHGDSKASLLGLGG